MSEFSEFKKRFGKHLSDEEVILRAVMPEEQIDNMLANQDKEPAIYNPQFKSIKSLISELSQRPGLKHVKIEKPGFILELRGN